MSDSPEEELRVPEGWTVDDVSLPEPAAAEPAEHSEDEVQCPVCREHSPQESYAAQGLVIEGVRAMLNHDVEQIKAIADCLTQYDGHVAITMVTIFLQDLSMITGVPLEAVLNNYRKFVNDAQAEGE